MKVRIFCAFGLKMPIHDQKLRPWRIGSLNGELYQRSLKAHHCTERRHMTYRSSTLVHWCDLCAWRRDQKRRRKKPYVASWVFAQTTHVVRSKHRLAWWVMVFRIQVSNFIKIGWAVTELWGVEIWLISLLRPIACLHSYTRTLRMGDLKLPERKIQNEYCSFDIVDRERSARMLSSRPRCW